MRFRCGRWRRLWYEFWKRRETNKEEWHKWFALYPVKVGFEDCRWLETVERRKINHRLEMGAVTMHYNTYHWDYREC